LEIDPEDFKRWVSNWHQAEIREGYTICEDLYRGLYTLGQEYSHGPMPIQTAVFKNAIADRKDVIAAAHTGSGKTLADLLLLLNNIVNDQIGKLARKAKGLVQGELHQFVEALVIVPSRELAMQVHRVSKALLDGLIGKEYAFTSAVVVGGLSHDKQARLLDRHKPKVIVETPGRIWGLTFGTREQKGAEVKNLPPSKHLETLSGIKFLVLDEADAMTDSKKADFAELQNILTKLRIKTRKQKNQVQKMVFSATLAVPPHLKKQFSKLK